MPTQFDFGFLVGLLVGEGHFGGDGRQPQVTLRMHVRHEAIFRWLEQTFPGGRLYGPYNHGGRHYLQWMARGAYLRDELAPMLDQFLSPSLDRHSFDRYQLMKARYPQLTARDAANGESISALTTQLDQVSSLLADSQAIADPLTTSGLMTPSLRSSDQSAAARPAVTAEISNALSTAAQPAPSAGNAATLDEILAQLRESWPS
jgi:glutathione S-transferase